MGLKQLVTNTDRGRERRFTVRVTNNFAITRSQNERIEDLFHPL